MYQYLFMLLLCLVPELAHAQIFTPPDGDLAMKILGALFPNLMRSGGADPFAGPMSNLCGACLIVGGLLVANTLFVGTVGTAHDGEFMGKKLHSSFTPIRYTIFTALVLPVAKGYCGMQLVVFALVVNGVGLADNILTAFMSSQNLTASVTASLTPPDATQLAYKTFESLVCMDLVTSAMQSSDAQSLNGGSSFGQTTETGTLNTYIYFGDKNEVSSFRKDSCGQIAISNYQVPAVQTSSFSNFMFNLSDGYARMKTINGQLPSEVQTLISTLQPYAAQVAQGQTVDPSVIENAATKFSTDMKTFAEQQVQQMDAFNKLAQNATQNGFVTAGAWFVPISQLMDLAQRSIADIPTATGPVSMDTSIVQDKWETVMKPLEATLHKAGQELTLGIDKQTGGDQSWWDAIKSTVKGHFDPNIILNKAFSSATSFVLIDGENPIMAQKRMGGWVLGTATAAYTALTALEVTVGNAPGIGSAITTVITLFVGPMFLVGIFLSYVLPFMPFLIWIGAVVGWVVLVIEAVFAAPLWAVMHLTTNGDEMVGSGANGYRLALSLLLRPALLTLGFCAGLVVSNVFGTVINMLFGGAFLLSQSDSGFVIKLIGCLIVSPVLYGALMFTFNKKMFDLSVHMADELINWFGGGGPNLGQMAQDFGGAHSHSFAAAAVLSKTVTQGAESMANKNLNGGGAPTLSGPKPDVKEARAGKINSMKEDIAQSVAASDSRKDMTSGPKTLGELKAERVSSGINHAVSTFGGEGSAKSEEFMDDLNSRIEKSPDVPVEKHLRDAFVRGINTEFGQHSAGVLSAMSGRKLSGEDFQRGYAMYQASSQSLADSGMEPRKIKDTLSTASNAARASFQESELSVENGGPATMTYFLDKELKNIEIKPDA